MSASSPPAPPRTLAVVSALCAAEVLTMVGVFAFPALLPGFMAEWGLSNTDAGWISGITFAGYAAAVPVLTGLTDRIDARRVYLAGALVAAASTLGFALVAEGFWSAMLLRALGGVGLAGTYMPGLKALVDRTTGPKQPRWISFYTASFSLGTSGSFLISGAVGAWAGWRAAYGVAAGTALAATLLVAVALGKAAPSPSPSPPPLAKLFDFRPVFRNRAAMGYMLGYSCHTWELFGARSWTVAFLAYALSLQPGAAGVSPTTAATLASLLAMFSSIGGADLAARFDRRRLCMAGMLLSAAVALVVGFAAPLPYGWVVALVLAYHVFIQIDSAALTTGAVIEAEPSRRGATIAIHSLMGFAAGFLGPLLFGVVLDSAGGTARGLAWGLAFASLGAVGMLGPLALGWSRRAPLSAGQDGP
jgi:MFS family permease